MKKYSLTLILVLVLFVITGGVFATWTYFNGQATSLENQSPKITLDTEVTSSPKGKIELVNNTLVLKVGPADVGNNTPTLTVEGTLEVKFTPTTENGTTEIGEFNGWNVGVTISGLGTNYNGHPIFTVTASTDINNSNNVKIDSGNIGQYVKIASDVLTKPSDLDAYKTAFGSPVIKFTFSEQDNA